MGLKKVRFIENLYKENLEPHISSLTTQKSGVKFLENLNLKTCGFEAAQMRTGILCHSETGKVTELYILKKEACIPVLMLYSQNAFSQDYISLLSRGLE